MLDGRDDLLDRVAQVFDRRDGLLHGGDDVLDRCDVVLDGRDGLQHRVDGLLHRSDDVQHGLPQVQHGRHELLHGRGGLQTARPPPLSLVRPDEEAEPIGRWPAALTIGERRAFLTEPGPTASAPRAPRDEDLPADLLEAEGRRGRGNAPALADTAKVIEALARTPAPGWAAPSWLDGDAAERRGLIPTLVGSARRRLAALVEGGIAHGRLDVAGVTASLAEGLAEELDVLLFRPLTLERRIADLEGRGAAWDDRDFRDHLRDPSARRDFLEIYPALLRQIDLRTGRWLAASVETLRRLAADRRHVERTFGIASDDRLVSAHATSGDPHDGGRRVTRLRFASGARLIYKPRPLGSTRVFQDLLDAMNQAGLSLALRTVAVADRGGHGWMEHVRDEACRSERAVGRYFRRAGSLLAALHLLGGSDCHLENVVAAGDQPVVVDLETLLAPEPPARDGSASSRAEFVRDSSVLGVGMLPSIDGTELGALGAVPGRVTSLETIALVGADTPHARVERVAWRIGDVESLPRFRGSRRPAGDHAADVEAGYAEGYETLRGLRPQILSRGGMLDRLGSQTVRVVLRPTAYYSDLLREATHPFALNDAHQSDRALSALWSDAPDRLRLAAAPSELRQLRAADVPHFGIRGRSRILALDPPGPNRFAFARSGREAAARRLARMGPRDLGRQRGLIRAAFGIPLAMAARPVARSDAVRAAGEIGERLVAEAVTTPTAASWLHLPSPREDGPRSPVPVDGDFYDGLLGIALFLGRLHAATGRRRLATLARKALREASGRSMHDLGTGVFDGLGGIVYALPHLAGLLGDDELFDRAERAADLASRRVAADPRSADLASGSAGLVLAGLSLRAARPGEAAERLLAASGAHLRTVIRDMGTSGAVPSLPFSRGAAHGWSGVVLAAARLAGAVPDVMPAEVVEAAIAIEMDLTAGGRWTDPGDEAHSGQATWCHGAPGIALCRLAAARAFPHGTLEAGALDASEASWRVDAAEMPEPGLCHGTMGVLDAVIAAGAPPGDGECRVEPATWKAPAPDAPHAFRPGLMTGMAGVGLGLLRLAHPSLPDPLTLDPPGATPRAPRVRTARSAGRPVGLR